LAAAKATQSAWHLVILAGDRLMTSRGVAWAPDAAVRLPPLAGRPPCGIRGTAGNGVTSVGRKSNQGSVAGVQTSSPHAKKPLGNPPAINLLTRLVHWALESCNGSQGAGVLRTGQVQDIKITICGGESIGFLCNQLIPQVANFLLPLRCVHFSESLVLSIIRRFSQPRPLTIFSWH
jgi:hypothetical protein